jgi:hypothetical protein
MLYFGLLGVLGNILYRRLCVKIWHGTLKRDLVSVPETMRSSRRSPFVETATYCDTVFTNGSKVGALYVGAGDGVYMLLSSTCTRPVVTRIH